MDRKLVLILAESALETVPSNTIPPNLRRLPPYQRRRQSYDILLDATAHKTFLNQLPHQEKRGRPDIIHRALLSAIGTPLYKLNHLQVFIQTFDDRIIKINQEVRPPRNYNRFVGLMEQLFALARVPPEGKPLMYFIDCNLESLIKGINPTLSILFSETGTQSSLEIISERIINTSRPVILVGGFPHGPFQEKTRKLCDQEVSISREVLSSSIVIARVLYEYEKRLTIMK